MGGNVQINGQSADRIDLRKIDKNILRSSISEVLYGINQKFWYEDLFASKKFLSGSSAYLFDDKITHEDLIKYKPTFGDIDLQIDKSQKLQVKEFLDTTVQSKIGNAILIGYKSSVDQFITLWKFENFGINVQIDFEFVDFENNVPTSWSQFAHSSSWEDTKANVKGVFHKYLIRAFTTKTLCDIIVLTGKKQTPKKMKATQLAFSVTRGLRKKLQPVYENGIQKTVDGLAVYKEIPTTDSEYIKDISKIFKMLFDRSPSQNDVSDFSSFIGCARIANRYLSVKEKHLLVEGFLFTLFDISAQKLYREDNDRDRTEKGQALKILLEVLNMQYDTQEIEKSYYEKCP